MLILNVWSFGTHRLVSLHTGLSDDGTIRCKLGWHLHALEFTSITRRQKLPKLSILRLWRLQNNRRKHATPMQCAFQNDSEFGVYLTNMNMFWSAKWDPRHIIEGINIRFCRFIYTACMFTNPRVFVALGQRSLRAKTPGGVCNNAICFCDICISLWIHVHLEVLIRRYLFPCKRSSCCLILSL